MPEDRLRVGSKRDPLRRLTSPGGVGGTARTSGGQPPVKPQPRGTASVPNAYAAPTASNHPSLGRTLGSRRVGLPVWRASLTRRSPRRKPLVFGRCRWAFDSTSFAHRQSQPVRPVSLPVTRLPPTRDINRRRDAWPASPTSRATSPPRRAVHETVRALQTPTEMRNSGSRRAGTSERQRAGAGSRPAERGSGPVVKRRVPALIDVTAFAGWPHPGSRPRLKSRLRQLGKDGMPLVGDFQGVPTLTRRAHRQTRSKVSVPWCGGVWGGSAGLRE